ncbi:SLC13 family permease [Kangiella profundi]|uniref:SLC13 family permease n=1 Tax=Kangiella profundi TaxID=1561924 RepID=A0A2K9AYU2_9GAMM|nr:SLC13 family permease [Kangiella profundi]AUD77848.1 SLC13 family permease [Kangiella profundi]GGE92003.1 sodium:sulfate symporter [Kangiella profundi]
MPFPDLPNNHALFVLLLTAFALYLFRRDDIPLETSCVIVLLALTIGFSFAPFHNFNGRLEPMQFFSGFGHEALVAVCALMICGQGLVRTGALEPIGRFLGSIWKSAPLFSLLLTLLIAGALSAFVNNTPIVVLLLPILVSVAIRTKTSPSALLMPMGFATIIGGMATTIGTSTNLLVVSVASDLGLPDFGMFDFLVPASIAAIVAIIYLWLIAPRILPERQAVMKNTSPRVFTAQLHIEKNSFADGKTLSEVINKTDGQMKVVRIQRGDEISIVPMPDAKVKAGDRLRVIDTPEHLKEYEQVLGAKLYRRGKQISEDHPLTAENQQLSEIVVTPGSPLAGRTLKDVEFIDQYGLVAIALHRGDSVVDMHNKGLGTVTLHVGDVLLVQGGQKDIAEFKKSGEILILDATTDLPKSHRAPRALFIMGLVVLLAAVGALPIAISALGGAMLMILVHCMTWREAMHALSAQVILIVASSLALGIAMIETGAAEYLAQAFVASLYGAPPAVLLSGLMLLLALLTNVVSNNAAAVIGTPIAVSIANQLNLPAEPFVIAVLFGANMSFATPMAYKTNLLVMSAGGYKFSDFIKVGVPLVILMWITLSFVLPILYQF